ncbi:Serine/threonine-protein phosphatase 2 (plasmid) [Sulfitobacter sp. DSM 110093]|uniref:metallophosphoesterase family protein n=1 Tax=Sulfitobacter sp. DSM 110093 TaxID=2883127 RepID=UPI001FADE647|nr:metallophosphoesterase family protein [Sulfitobacter sp. DSM 110093]UOA34119.1 Serine/threonine-protein phosphatase 2 [Sulfitobacter sp. DSM 110093]
MLTRIKSKLNSWQGRSEAQDAGASISLRPEVPFFAVGDIHGCAALLSRLFDRLDEAALGQETCVFLGDYIDRGAQSRHVLLQLYEISQLMPERVICLMGNHERMMLDFIDDPAGAGSIWLQNGGAETLESFGIGLRRGAMDAEVSVHLADQLEAALPGGMQDWLRGLPMQWSTGNIYCVHAALSPKRAPDDQRAQVMLWGHPDFLKAQREDGNIVVHGHTIVKNAGLEGGRIAVDTGAYRTGRLSAVHILQGDCKVIETR